MPALAASRRNLTPLHASRIRRPAAVGLLVAVVIGVLCFQGARRPSTPVAQSLLPATKSSAPATAEASVPARAVWPSSSAPAAAQAAEAVAWSEKEKEAIRIRAQNEPGVVAAWAAALPVGDNRRFALETAALAWGDRDPAAAARWARTLANDAERACALTNIAGEAVRSEPLLALELARSLPDAARDEIVPRAAMEWAAQDPADAADWARKIPAESLRATVLAGIATAWSDQDPVGGATLAAKELPAGRLQADAVVSIVQRWAQRAPADAAGWVLQFPEGDLRDAAMESLERYATTPP